MLALAALLVLGLGARPLLAQERSSRAAELFHRYAPRVVKVEVTETGSAAKAELGSGFFVSAHGHVVTNYHVVSQLVQHPERYQASLIEVAGRSFPVHVLAVDVVHDLAVLESDARPVGHFRLTPVAPEHGARLFALGHPHDLGLSIVEGIYNGLLEHSLYPKIHFTGSINPGMSGGPALDEQGRVVGINVSTAGNQVSFLVPVERAAELVSRALAPDYEAPDDFLPVIAGQLRAYQAEYLDGIFADTTQTVTLGRFRLPTQPAPFFKCWADADRDRDLPYQVVYHECSTDDYVYLSGDQSSGIIEMQHELITSTELSPSRFFSLYSEAFSDGDGMPGSDEDVTPFRCETRNVRTRARTYRAVLCVRGYKKLGGLYDAIVKMAALGTRTSGLMSTLRLSGVSFENVQRVTRRYLESFRWADR
ncbi:MAG TPA: serine protease [Gemmatimonadaceae bacterium]|nr:serine protease [Gemmatimonadaceae bacterium]